MGPSRGRLTWPLALCSPQWARRMRFLSRRLLRPWWRLWTSTGRSLYPLALVRHCGPLCSRLGLMRRWCSPWELEGRSTVLLEAPQGKAEEVHGGGWGCLFCYGLDQAPSLIQPSQMGSLRRQPVTASCGPTCPSSGSRPSSRVSLLPLPRPSHPHPSRPLDLSFLALGDHCLSLGLSFLLLAGDGRLTGLVSKPSSGIRKQRSDYSLMLGPPPSPPPMEVSAALAICHLLAFICHPLTCSLQL